MNKGAFFGLEMINCVFFSMSNLPVVVVVVVEVVDVVEVAVVSVADVVVVVSLARVVVVVRSLLTVVVVIVDEVAAQLSAYRYIRTRSRINRIAGNF